MAIFTQLSFADAAALLERVNAGRLTALEAIACGVDNTNYFADTTQGRYVVTVFERLGLSELPFYLELMLSLARRGLPVPEPQSDRAGEIVHTLCGKPAAVTNRLPGSPQLAPGPGHIEQVATTLAQLHLAGQSYPRVQPNPRGLAFWTQTVPQVAPFVTTAQQALMRSELALQQQLAASPDYLALPRGAIHADLFRDNVLFDGDRLSGVLDFYFAGVDSYLFDLAVCLNDWCSDERGELLEPSAAMFVTAYAKLRPLQERERGLMPMLLRAAALRFWLSRLADLYCPRSAALLVPRDPAHFERVLRLRVQRAWQPA